jgi:hypothetical protein
MDRMDALDGVGMMGTWIYGAVRYGDLRVATYKRWVGLGDECWP